ncbi:hypothetical protein GW17_00013223 [Ensete ventricosum]|nr:hypothetical protein GW17_00013223 [Ensete ventricosum]
MVRWASLTLRHKVWADGADAQVVCRGILSLLLANEIYTTPSEVLVENVAKNLVTLDKVQCWKTEALKKVKALEKDLQGLKGDLEVAGAKN